MATERTLPEYENPPVVEVAIGVYFKPLGLTTAHFGGFWAVHREQYPRVEDQAPILEAAQSGILELPPLRRVMLHHSSDAFLMQLQGDLFVFNWRKTSEESIYVRFSEIKKRFGAMWASFCDFVAREQLGPIQPHRYEVAYVNHIVGEMGSFPSQLEKYTSLIQLRPASSSNFLPAPFALAADLQFNIPEQRGTLRISFKHGARPADQKDVLQMDLTARVNPRDVGDDLDANLELAHDWIVRGFTDLTSREAQENWGRTS